MTPGIAVFFLMKWIETQHLQERAWLCAAFPMDIRLSIYVPNNYAGNLRCNTSYQNTVVSKHLMLGDGTTYNALHQDGFLNTVYTKRLGEVNSDTRNVDVKKPKKEEKMHRAIRVEPTTKR